MKKIILSCLSIFCFLATGIVQAQNVEYFYGNFDEISASDVLAQDLYSGNLAIYLNGESEPSFVTTNPWKTSWELHTADFNCDRITDIFAVDRETGRVKMVFVENDGWDISLNEQWDSTSTAQFGLNYQYAAGNFENCYGAIVQYDELTAEVKVRTNVEFSTSKHFVSTDQLRGFYGSPIYYAELSVVDNAGTDEVAFEYQGDTYYYGISSVDGKLRYIGEENSTGDYGDDGIEECNPDVDLDCPSDTFDDTRSDSGEECNPDVDSNCPTTIYEDPIVVDEEEECNPEVNLNCADEFYEEEDSSIGTYDTTPVTTVPEPVTTRPTATTQPASSGGGICSTMVGGGSDNGLAALITLLSIGLFLVRRRNA